MNYYKSFGRAGLMSLLILFSSFITAAQSDDARPTIHVEPSYDVALHLLIGSNDGAKGELPASLTNISKQLKANFTFSNYRLASTFLGRISNTGTFEYKSIGNLFGPETETSPHTFLEWSVANFRNMPTAKGQTGFQAQTFRFGARVPVAVSSLKSEGSATLPVYNYESIGLTLARFGLAENTPTLLGTLNLPGANGVIFLVMTVRPADM
jgi:hypothetical protein